MYIKTVLLPTSGVWTEIDQKLLEYISLERREKVLKYRYDKDRKISLYSALIVRSLACKYTKQSNQHLVFSYNKYNKPFLNSGTDFFFNISHTTNCILCATAPVPVGADIEKIGIAPFEVGKYIFHEEEEKYIDAGMTKEDRNSRFYIVWTQKEALSKYNGTGLTEDIKRVNTRDEKYQSFYKTWGGGKYICSVYTGTELKCIHENMTEKDIQREFLKNPV